MLDQYIKCFKLIWGKNFFWGDVARGDDPDVREFEWLSYCAYFVLISGITLLVYYTFPTNVNFLGSVVIPVAVTFLCAIFFVVLCPLLLVIYLWLKK